MKNHGFMYLTETLNILRKNYSISEIPTILLTESLAKAHLQLVKFLILL